MGNIKTKVESTVAQSFDNAQTELEEIQELGKLSGHVLWSGFAGMPDKERQRVLWKKLRESLSPPELLSLSLILTFTPQEYDAIIGHS